MKEYPVLSSILMLAIVANPAWARPKTKIVLQVVDHITALHMKVYPGMAGSATTTCTSGGEQCNTTFSPSQMNAAVSNLAPYMEYVYAVMPDGRHVTLEYAAFNRLVVPILNPGSYEADTDGGDVFVLYVHNPDPRNPNVGKPGKLRYRIVGTWGQQSAPPASNQTLTTDQVFGTPKSAQSSLPPAYDLKRVADLKKQADTGDAATQCSLGFLYEKGDDVPQNYTEAAAWYRKAAEQGYAEAQYLLGGLYKSGYGVPQDYAQTALWYRKAAEQGYSMAQFDLGLMYDKGQGVPQNYTEAAAWYRKAAEQHNLKAQWLLGALYHEGLGVPHDEAEAYFWYDLAAAAASGLGLVPQAAEQIAKDRDEAASHLTPADLSREQERARKWFEDHRARP